MHFERPDESFEFIVRYSSVTVHANGSVSVVTHKPIELNKTCKDAILKALSTVINENRIKCKCIMKSLNIFFLSLPKLI